MGRWGLHLKSGILNGALEDQNDWNKLSGQQEQTTEETQPGQSSGEVKEGFEQDIPRKLSSGRMTVIDWDQVLEETKFPSELLGLGSENKRRWLKTSGRDVRCAWRRLTWGQPLHDISEEWGPQKASGWEAGDLGPRQVDEQAEGLEGHVRGH